MHCNWGALGVGDPPGRLSQGAVGAAPWHLPEPGCSWTGSMDRWLICAAKGDELVVSRRYVVDGRVKMAG